MTSVEFLRTAFNKKTLNIISRGVFHELSSNPGDRCNFYRHLLLLLYLAPKCHFTKCSARVNVSWWKNCTKIIKLLEVSQKCVLLDYFNDQMITLSKLITEANGNVRHLRPIGPIKIIYKNDVSVIEFKGDECVPFTNSGFFDSRYLWWRGDMSDQRIAELLPFEYWP